MQKEKTEVQYLLNPFPFFQHMNTHTHQDDGSAQTKQINKLIELVLFIG